MYSSFYEATRTGYTSLVSEVVGDPVMLVLGRRGFMGKWASME